MRRKLTLTSQMLVQWGVPVACYFWISVSEEDASGARPINPINL